MFNINSKYLSFFNNKLPASWVAHIARDFLRCYSCSYYSSMILEVQLGSQYTLSVVEWLLDRFAQSNKFWKKTKKKLCGIWPMIPPPPPHCPLDVLWKSSRRRPENVLEASRINLPGTSLERQIRTSCGHHFRMSPERQIGTSPGCQIGTYPGWLNRIFRRRPQDVLGTNICRLGIFYCIIS